MSARNIFIFLAVFLTAVVAAAAILAWQPQANPFLFLNQAAYSKMTQAEEEPAPHAAALTNSGGKSDGGTVENGYTVYTVTYDGKTFSPRILVIDRGETVRFVNTSGGTTMRVDVTLLGNVPSPARFTEAESVGKNGSYELNFNQPGVWSFINMNGNKDANGVVYVRDVQ